MNIRVLGLCAFICLVLIGCRQAPRYEKELERLDEALARNEEWVARKEHAIAQLREKLARAVQDEERYWINKDLYFAYLEFDADSAGYYVEQNIGLAARMGKPEDVECWHIEQAMVLIQTGQLNEAAHVLEGIDRKVLSNQSLAYYYSRMMQLNHARSIYVEEMGTAERSRYFAQALTYRDSVLLYLDPNSPEFLNIKAWDSFDAHDYDGIKQQLRERVDHSPLNTPEDAISAYNLSAMCREDGEREDHIYYLVRSAIAYVQSGSRNYASESIQELSEVLLWLGDLSRAYTYINYCSSNIYSFKNRAYIVRIARLQEDIRKQYLARESRHEVLISGSLWAISVLLLGLLGAFFYIYRQVRKLRLRGGQLKEANAALQASLVEKEQLHAGQRRLNEELRQANSEQAALNDQLSRTNALLKQANVVKEEYIGYAFSICADYMSKLNEFRKTVSRKLKTGQLKELDHFLTSDTMMQSELKSFYRTFDEVFLFLFPTFVADLNALLLPDKQIELKDEAHLNTDLRIVALMSLGFTDANKIAEFLHCSTQSVYNSRRLMYGRLAISLKEFKERVTTLGRGK